MASSKSVVWTYFDKIMDTIDEKRIRKAICKTCKKSLTYSTSGMKKHLQTHNINVTLGESAPSENESFDVQPKISNYFQKNQPDTLPSLLSRLCAKDGFSFHAIAKSQDLKKMITNVGLGPCPTSAPTIKALVVEFAQTVVDLYKSEIAHSLQQVGLLTLSFDEWTSLRNRRYVNLIVHTNRKMFCLGLKRITGRTNALLFLEDIKSLLLRFDLSLDNFFGFITDGAALNAAVARNSNKYQQKCIAHGIQLAVNHCLYDSISQNQVLNAAENESDDSISVNEEEIDNEFEDNCSFQYKKEDINILIKNVRQICRFFRKSTVANDLFHQHQTDISLRGRSLILDVKTRWSSLCEMLERFFELRDVIEYSLHVLKKTNNSVPSPPTPDEIDLLQSVVNSLKCVKDLVLLICKADCTVYDCHLALEDTIRNLMSQNTVLSIELAKSIKTKCSERISMVYSLNIFLKDHRSITHSEVFVNAFPRIKDIENELFKMAESIQKCSSLNETEATTSDSSSSSSFPSPGSPSTYSTTTLADRIGLIKKQKVVATLTLKERLQIELKTYKLSNVKGPMLQKIEIALDSLRPSTIDAERVFSISGQFCSKLRSRMNDETLSDLVLLRSYYSSHCDLNKNRF